MSDGSGGGLIELSPFARLIRRRTRITVHRIISPGHAPVGVYTGSVRSSSTNFKKGTEEMCPTDVPPYPIRVIVTSIRSPFLSGRFSMAMSFGSASVLIYDVFVGEDDGDGDGDEDKVAIYLLAVESLLRPTKDLRVKKQRTECLSEDDADVKVVIGKKHV